MISYPTSPAHLEELDLHILSAGDRVSQGEPSTGRGHALAEAAPSRGPWRYRATSPLPSFTLPLSHTGAWKKQVRKQI